MVISFFICILLRFIELSDGIVLVSHDEEVTEEINRVKREYDDLENDIEEVMDSIHEEEEVTDDEDETTELSKDLRRYEEEKDEFIAESSQRRDEVLFDEGDARREKYMLLDELERAIDKDIDKMSELMDEIPQEDSRWDKISEIHDKLVEKQEEVSRLQEDLQSRELPPLPFRQDSSDISKTDFDPSDYYDD